MTSKTEEAIKIVKLYNPALCMSQGGISLMLSHGRVNTREAGILTDALMQIGKEGKKYRRRLKWFIFKYRIKELFTK